MEQQLAVGKDFKILFDDVVTDVMFFIPGFVGQFHVRSDDFHETFSFGPFGQLNGFLNQRMDAVPIVPHSGSGSGVAKGLWLGTVFFLADNNSGGWGYVQLVIGECEHMIPEFFAVIIHVSVSLRAELYHQSDDGFHRFLSFLRRFNGLGVQEHFLYRTAIFRELNVRAFCIVCDIEVVHNVESGQLGNVVNSGMWSMWSMGLMWSIWSMGLKTA
jgi:hypothetical protein